MTTTTTTSESPKGPQMPWPPRQRNLLELAARGMLPLVLLCSIVLFSILVSDIFPTRQNFQTVVGAQTVPIVLAIAVMIPLITGEFDISLAALMGTSSLLLAKLTVESHMAVPLAVLITLAFGLGVGSVTAVLVVKLRLNSFIASLAVGTLLAGVSSKLSDTVISGVPASLTDLAGVRILGVSATAYAALAVALLVGYVLSQTPLGRRCYVVGSNPEAARLSGVPSARIKAGALASGAVLASLAAVLNITRVGASDPNVGPEFLLPAFAAVFLGATMGIGGRFGALGTVVAIFVLAVGINGLQLIGVASWVEPVFNGTSLLLALLLSRLAGDISERTGHKVASARKKRT